MGGKKAISTEDKLGYLLVYRSWFLLLSGILFFIGALSILFIVMELSTTGLVLYTSKLMVALIIDCALLVASLIWSFSTEYRISKARKLLVSELLSREPIEEEKESVSE